MMILRFSPTWNLDFLLALLKKYSLNHLQGTTPPLTSITPMWTAFYQKVCCMLSALGLGQNLLFTH